MELHPLVAGFDGIAQEYEHGRPGYPEAVAREIADAAGASSLTRRRSRSSTRSSPHGAPRRWPSWMPSCGPTGVDTVDVPYGVTRWITRRLP